MGSGATSLKKAPKHLKLYGDDLFHLRPKGSKEEGYHFALRPSYPGHGLELPFMIEGEFGTGKYSFDFEKKQRNKGEYKDVRYVYYRVDVPDMNVQQKDIILKWAIDGQL